MSEDQPAFQQTTVERSWWVRGYKDGCWAELTKQPRTPPADLTTVAYPDSVAMRCLLKTMRDNPGAVAPSAAIGAVAWALGRIKYLEDCFLTGKRPV